MHPTDPHTTREPHMTSQAPASEPIAECPRSWRVPVATNPVTCRRFCAAMYDYCLTPQYWEAF
jgi:hypothetical protein